MRRYKEVLKGLSHTLILATLLIYFILSGSGYAEGKSSTPTQSDLSDIAAEIRDNIKTMLTTQTDIVPLPDIPMKGAPGATLEDAAYYAWQEFIALNWAAVKQKGSLGEREQADISKKFGEPADDSSTAYPALVWETFRHKVEIYPGQGTPHGYQMKAGKPNQSKDYGYDALPEYQYQNRSANISTPPGKTPWINLDEVSQIGTNEIYSGLAAEQSLTEGPGRLILFLAKANRSQYQYIASRGWWSSGSANVYSPGPAQPFEGTIHRTKEYIKKNKKPPSPQPVIGRLQNAEQQSKNKELVSFPNGTMEIKTAWRLASESEQNEYSKNGYVSGYHANMIRYYASEGSGSEPANFNAKDTLGVMMGLHIIHKTPTAPYFIFASFEHKDNIRRADGTPLEDANGNIVGNLPTNITTSEVTTDVSNPQMVTVAPGKQQQMLTQQTFTPDENSASSYTNNRQSYFVNTANSGLASDNSSQPKIGVNKRRFAIPSEVVNVNSDVHRLITSANSAASNPWGNYRLTNVQWKPVTKTAGSSFVETDEIKPATYYMSNSVIETNHILSKFSGQFFGNVGNAENNTITDFQIPQGYQNEGTVNINDVIYHKGIANGKAFDNVYYNSSGYLMGGCMGCHGNQQVSGSDFSFIFASRVTEPDSADNAPINADIGLWNPNGSGAAFVYYGKGDGLFDNQTAWSWPSSPQSGQIFSGDFNGDAISDIGLWNPNHAGNAYIYYGKGDGTFENQTVWNWPSSPQSGAVFTGDFNNDGLSDIGLWNPNHAGNAYIYYGKGDGTFENQTAWNWPTSPQSGSVFSGDFNDDGYSDIGLWNPNKAGNAYIYYGNGNGNGDGSFKNETAWNWPGSPQSGSVFSGDFNDDGFSDIGLWNPNKAGNAYIYYGEGNGQFQDQTSWNWSSSPQAGNVFTGHFN